MTHVKLFNIQHFSLHDGPGIRTVVFFKGCPLDCAWCHNPESKNSHEELAYYSKNCTFCQRCAVVCPNGVHTVHNGLHEINREKCTTCGKCSAACDFSALEIIGRNYTVEEILDEIQKDDMFFTNGGGVTASGGEPFMQFEGLYTLAKRCKEKKYSFCIETSGFTDEKNIRKIAEYVDFFLYDYKLTNPEEHKKYVGADNKTIVENLSVLEEIGANVILRCPIIPHINDCEDHFKGIGTIVNAYRCILHVELLPYHPLGISKAEQIGEEAMYPEPDFLQKETLQQYAKKIKFFTNKEISIGG